MSAREELARAIAEGSEHCARGALAALELDRPAMAKHEAAARAARDRARAAAARLTEPTPPDPELAAIAGQLERFIRHAVTIAKEGADPARIEEQRQRLTELTAELAGWRDRQLETA